MARSKSGGKRGGASRKKEDPRVVSAVKDRVTRCALSPREAEILHAAVGGQSRAQMCKSAKISDNTLKSEVRVLMKKLAATNLQEVVIGVLRDALGKRR
jgi:DNA-binding NarL/FixJ family response regulator